MKNKKQNKKQLRKLFSKCMEVLGNAELITPHEEKDIWERFEDFINDKA